MVKFEKGQLARLYDVFILGPLLIYVSKELKSESFLYAFIITSGITTIFYNGYNYIGNILNNSNIETNDYNFAVLFVVILFIVYKLNN